MGTKTSGTAIFAAFFLFSVSPAFASGFGIFTQGASALGQADAVVAHTDGPSAIFFNPALINSLPGTQVELGTTIVVPSRKFTSAQDGSVSRTDDTAFFPSTFYITHAFNERVSAGLGVFNPFGLGTTWKSDWEGRYLATESEMTTFNINPVVSVRLNQHVTVAGGVDIILLDATFKNRLNLTGATGGAFGVLDDGTQTLKGDGTGFGYNFGVHVKFTDDLSLGASYRSQVNVDIKGDLTTDIPASVTEPAYGILSGVLPQSKAKTVIKLPQQVFTGLHYKGFGPLELEAGVRWEGWSSYKQLRIDMEPAVAGSSSSTRPKNWKDTFSYMLGASYRLNDTATLLGGYLYGDDPVPDETFEPAIPDSPSHLFCLGTELNLSPVKLTMSYGYQVLERRHKSNPLGDPAGLPGTGTANGMYDSELHLVGISLLYRF